MNALKQIVAVVGMNVRSLRSRLAASLVIVIGMAAVVGVTLSIFSLAAGIGVMTKITTAPDRMSVYGQGGGGFGGGPVSRDSLSIIADTPGTKLGSDGKPLLYGIVGGPCYFTRKKENGVDVCVTFTGVGSNVLEVRPNVKIIEGRMFTPGLREVIVGKAAVEHFEGIALGEELKYRDGSWKIVGVFDASGTHFEYLIWGDSETLASAQRSNMFAVIFSRLDADTKAAQDAYTATLESNPSVKVDVQTEEEARARNMQNPTQLYSRTAYVVGILMALGATFAAINTMYAAVASRITEIATLRAIGFGATPVVTSILVEALLLAVVGAAIGGTIAWVLFDDRVQSHVQIAIKQDVSPTMIAMGVGVSVLVGFLGALFPAIRAARMPVVTALQVR